MSDKEWSERLLRDREQVRHCEDWIAASHPPEERSALAGDDRLYRPLPVSRAAIQGLGSAVDHLGLFHSALEETHESRPLAYFTLARTAMFSAARTIWILCPPQRSERQKRALWFAYEDLRQYRNFTMTMRDDFEDKDLVPRAIAEIDGRQRQMESAAAKLNLTLNRQNKTSDTDIVAAAGMWLDSQPSAGDKTGHSLRILWRIHSGHAHGLSWSMQGKQEVVTRNEDGSGVIKETVTIPELAVASQAASVTTNEALVLYEQRATRP
jgi:hypothetical protein